MEKAMNMTTEEFEKLYEEAMRSEDNLLVDKALEKFLCIPNKEEIN